MTDTLRGVLWMGGAVLSFSTMAIAALILFFLGSGPVKGFAVVFILGILTTVITAVTLTRMMIAVWYNTFRPKTLPF